MKIIIRISLSIIGVIIEEIARSFIKQITVINIEMEKSSIICIIIGLILLVALWSYWLVSDYMKKTRLMEKVLKIVQAQRYYENGVIDTKKVNSDKEKVLIELKKELRMPENKIEKLIAKYF